MRSASWVIAMALMSIAALRYWAAWRLHRRMWRVPPSRVRVAPLIILSTLAASFLGIVLGLTVVFAAYDLLGSLAVAYLVLVVLALAAALPGIVFQVRRSHESWLEDWRKAPPR